MMDFSAIGRVAGAHTGRSGPQRGSIPSVTKPAARLERLVREAERAASELHRMAGELDEIAASLPARETNRKRELHNLGERSRVAGDLLLKEATAAAVTNAGLVARVSREIAIFAAGALTAISAGAAEGATSAIVGRAFDRSRVVVECVDRVGAAAADAQVIEAFDAAADALRNDVVVFAEDDASPFPGGWFMRLWPEEFRARNRAQRWMTLDDAVGDLERTYPREAAGGGLADLRQKLDELAALFELLEGEERQAG